MSNILSLASGAIKLVRDGVSSVLSNVAAGIAATDAVNVAQMNAAISSAIITDGLIEITYADLLAAIAGGTIIPGQKYLVDFPYSEGIIATGATSTTVAEEIIYNALNADYQAVGDYSGFPAFVSQLGIWNTGLAPVIGDVAIWNNLHWRNITGANGTTPPGTDLLNWNPILVGVTRTTGYIPEAVNVLFDMPNGIFIMREDKNGNEIWGNTAISVFPWGNDNVANVNVNSEGLGTFWNTSGSINKAIISNGAQVTIESDPGVVIENIEVSILKVVVLDPTLNYSDISITAGYSNYIETVTLKSNHLVIIYNNQVGGPFTIGEIVTGATSGASATIVADNGATRILVNSISGTFVNGESISGDASLATADINGAPIFATAIPYDTLAIATFQIGEVISNVTSALSAGTVVFDDATAFLATAGNVGIITNNDSLLGLTSGTTALVNGTPTYMYVDMLGIGYAGEIFIDSTNTNEVVDRIPTFPLEIYVRVHPVATLAILWKHGTGTDETRMQFGTNKSTDGPTLGWMEFVMLSSNPSMTGRSIEYTT